LKQSGWVLLALPGLLGCGAFDVPFACNTDDQCVKTHAAGTCEPTGSCSYPDSTCPSRRRYADLAPDQLRNQCVPAPAHLALGDGQSCAALFGGELRCWGSTPKTQPDAVRSLGPSTDNMVVLELPSVSDVDLAQEHGCAVADGEVWCWGDNDHGQLGIDDASSPGPHQVPAATQGAAAESVATGRRHSCALERGRVRCWGRNEEGQLGRPNLTDALPPASAASALEDILELHAGGSHTCAQPAWGVLNCWGSNEFGQIAAPLEVAFSDEPHELSFYALEFSLGGSHTCAINTSGEVLCWGSNKLGQLGRPPEEGAPETQLSPTPLRVAKGGTTDGWLKATHIACGWAHSCAILDDGTVACWGDNSGGQLGPEAAGNAGVSTPVVVVLPGRAVEASAGFTHTCARTEDGLTWCWGGNERGQLGNGSVKDSPSPDARVSASLATP
jgi:alpha-tubulin suppressor-like RCC1 family protein